MTAGLAVRSAWDEAQHPRDGNGRFIEIGARVRMSELFDGGGEGTVERNAGMGLIEVRLDDGRAVRVHRGYLTVLARPDGSEPTTAEHIVAPAPVEAARPDIPLAGAAPAVVPAEVSAAHRDAIADQVAELTARYGAAVAIRMDTSHRPAPAYVSGHTIYLNPTYWAAGNEAAMTGVLDASKQHRYGGRAAVIEEVRDIITHEYGHVLDNLSTHIGHHKQAVLPHLHTDPETQRATDTPGMKAIVGAVSLYAASDPTGNEYVAEAFLAFHRGETSAWAAQVGAAFDADRAARA